MRTLTLALLAVAPGFSFAVQGGKPLLARNPALGAERIVFEFGTDLWTVAREGGRARRLTVGPGVESKPSVSPDGKWVAFNGEYDGNADVFVVGIEGGQPRRLTFHPGADNAIGWTPDGRSVLFASGMDHPHGNARLYTVPVGGGWPSALPLPRGMEGSYSPDGTRIAYVPNELWQPEWKRYKGGQTTPIWIARLSDSKVEKVPRENSNDRFPMWVGETVYFVSDRSGRSSLFSYEPGSKKVNRVLPPAALDIKSASAGPGGIVFERIGSIHLYDLETKTAKPVPIEVDDDIVEVRPGFRSVGNQIRGYTLSPSGARVAFEARGDIFTVPAEKGDARNLTNTPGTAERSPIWSPDGTKIAFLSDASGNYRLHVADAMDASKADAYDLGDKPNWYRTIEWAPDGKKILFVDQSLYLGYIDLTTKEVKRFERTRYYYFGERLNPNWSPDSRWIAFTRQLKNKLHAVAVYSLATGKSTQITDGLSDASSAIFDRGGKHLYFLASTDIGQSISFGGLSGFGTNPTYSAYVVNLRADDPSPFAPESDEEKGEPGPPPAGGAPAGGPAGGAGRPGVQGGPAHAIHPGPPQISIDFDGISQRILALPGVATASYHGMLAATPGNMLLLRGPAPGAPGGPTLLKFSLTSRQLTPFASNVLGAGINSKGDKAVIHTPGGFQVVSTVGPPPQPGQGLVNVGGLQARVDPRAEWRQMFHEVWRNMRDFFYDPNTHGLDIAKVKARYEPYLENLASRQDYNYLMQDMLNEVTVGHTFSGGGDVPSGGYVPGGLLGADYKIENGRYRFARVFSGENWNPDLRAPLTQPGAAVKAGEYLLKVNGRDLTAKDNVYEAFENTANRQVSITVGPSPDGTGSRTITVVPITSETNLRSRAWIEDNRRKVDALSGGRISYVYMPNTAGAGLTSFNRYFTAQLDKDAVLIDDRYNGGGALADYVVQILSRQVLGYAAQRDLEEVPIPAFSNEGPKAMLINEMAGSGGDALPWFFRTSKLGPLIGTRTWGGLVAARQGVPLMAGGFATAPQAGIYGLKGEWEVENHGVAPDIQVEEDPVLWRQGRDPQMETAVKYLMDQLIKNPPKIRKRPAYPNYHKDTGLGRGGG